MPGKYRTRYHPRLKIPTNLSRSSTFRRIYRNKFYRKRAHQAFGYNPMKALYAWNPFPPHYDCSMRYCETFTKSVGTAGVFGTVQKMNLNSLYDPNNTGGGHQPYGYDQIQALYKKYIVKSAKVIIEFINPNADGLVAGVMVLPSGQTGASLAGISADIIKEQPTSWTRPVQNTGSQKAIFKANFNMAKLEGLNRVQWMCSLDEYGASVTANPSLMPTIQFASASDASSSVDYLFARVLIIYKVRFYDRILQAYS